MPLPRKHCPSSITKGFLPTSLMRITALLSDKLVGNSPGTNREEIEISQVLIEILEL